MMPKEAARCTVWDDELADRIRSVNISPIYASHKLKKIATAGIYGMPNYEATYECEKCGMKITTYYNASSRNDLYTKGGATIWRSVNGE